MSDIFNENFDKHIKQINNAHNALLKYIENFEKVNYGNIFNNKRLNLKLELLKHDMKAACEIVNTSMDEAEYIINFENMMDHNEKHTLP